MNADLVQNLIGLGIAVLLLAYVIFNLIHPNH